MEPKRTILELESVVNALVTSLATMDAELKHYKSEVVGYEAQNYAIRLRDERRKTYDAWCAAKLELTYARMGKPPC